LGPNHPNIQRKLCACGQRTVTLITDNSSGQRYCHHCITPGMAHDAQRFAKKLDDLYAAGRLNEEDYPLTERIRNLNGDWGPVN
jgi:hypothetical protein